MIELACKHTPLSLIRALKACAAGVGQETWACWDTGSAALVSPLAPASTICRRFELVLNVPVAGLLPLGEASATCNTSALTDAARASGARRIGERHSRRGDIRRY